MKKLIFLMISLFVVSLNTNGQKTDSSWSPRISLSFPWFFNENNIPAVITNGHKITLLSSSFYPLGIGIQKALKKEMQIRFGISGLGFNFRSGLEVTDTSKFQTPYFNYENQSLNSSFYLEFTKQILKKKKHTKCFIGLGIYPHWGFYRSQPIYTLYPVNLFYYGAELAFLPVVTMDVFKNTVLELSMPVSLLSESNYVTRIENPAWANYGQNIKRFSLQTVPLYLRPCFTLIF